MSEHKIEAASVTKPIQLLAAWLVGLLALNASFLGAAAIIQKPAWAAGFLVICAAVNVPLFLICLFILQTKFRPEMQEDQFYAKYLAQRTSAETGGVEFVEIAKSATGPTNEVRRALNHFLSEQTGAPPPLRNTHRRQWSLSVRLNDLLPSFDETLAALSSAGITIVELFGTKYQSDTPNPVVASFSPHGPVAEIQQLLRLLDGRIDYISTIEAGKPTNEFYIGSYVYKSSKFKLVDFNELRDQLLDPGLREADLLSIMGPPVPFGEG